MTLLGGNVERSPSIIRRLVHVRQAILDEQLDDGGVAMLGGNVRVGLEDSLYISKGKLAESNKDQVAKIRRIVEDLGRSIAAPDEARQMLGLKGADATAI